jgi:hypothetical protein
MFRILTLLNIKLKVKIEFLCTVLQIPRLYNVYKEMSIATSF